MGAAENDGDGTAEIKPPELPEMAKGGGLKSNKSNKTGVASWQRKNEPVIPKKPVTVKNPAKSNYRASGWDGFSGGGPVGKYKNGEVPDSEMQTVTGYAGYGQAGRGKLHKSVANKFQSMIEAAKKDGHPLGINDTFRTIADQQHMYNTKPPGTAARPGTSNHGYGLAADLNYHDGGYKWLWANASKFGFKPLSGWGLSPNTPNATEAWHWENLDGSGTGNANVKTEPVTDAGGGSVTPPSSNGGAGGTGGESGGGQPSAAEQYKSTGSIVDFFKKSAGILGSYAKDASAMDDPGMPPSPIPTSTSMPKTPLTGIGPLVDGGAYAESLKPKSETNIGPVADGAAYATKINDVAKTSTAPSSINTKVEKLKSLSTSKVRRDKQPAKPNMMIAVQPVIKTKTVNAGGGGGGNSGPASSPLLTK